MSFFDNKIYDKTDFASSEPEKGEYDTCRFVQCNFLETDITGFVFIDCVFDSCDLSLCKLNNTILRDVEFINCKMLGLHFETCNELGLSVIFKACNLGHSSFYRNKLKKTIFKNSKLVEVDFSEADLTGAVFDNCDLEGAQFDNTNLEKADLSNSYKFIIDPETNKIKKAKFSLSGLPGLLTKYDIQIEK